MTNPSVAGFFSAVGKTPAKFPTVGTKISGTITAVHPPEPQTDIKTGAPIAGKEQIRIDLSTDERDPADEFDDGSRTLYVKGWMRGAIGDALRKAEAGGGPEVGGKLTVVFSGEKPPEVPGFNATKQYEAEYVKPSAAGSFFAGAATEGTAVGNGLVKPANFDQAVWDQMPESAKAAVAALSDDPPF